MTGSGKRRSRALLRAARFAMALLLLALLWRVADGAEAARILLAAEGWWLLAAFLALTMQTLLSAARWRITAAQLGIHLPQVWALREYYLSQVVNQSLPGGMIGDAGRAVRTRDQAGLMAAGQAVVFERLSGQAMLFGVMVAGFLATLLTPGGLVWPHWLLVPVAGIICAVLAIPVLVMLAGHLPGGIGRRMHGLKQAIAIALLSPPVLRWQILLSLGTTLCNLGSFWFCARALGVDLSATAVSALVPLILFTMLIPLSVSGWGFREGAAATLFPVAGATASEGLATSVAFGLVFMATVLPGVLPWLFQSAPPVKKI